MKRVDLIDMIVLVFVNDCVERVTSAKMSAALLSGGLKRRNVVTKECLCCIVESGNSQ
jgi:hypothetical protein